MSWEIGGVLDDVRASADVEGHLVSMMADLVVRKFEKFVPAGTAREDEVLVVLLYQSMAPLITLVRERRSHATGRSEARVSS